MHTPQLNTPCSPTDCPLSWPGLSLTLQPGPEPWPVWMPLLEPENTEPPFISPGSLGKLCNFFQPSVPPLENEAITFLGCCAAKEGHISQTHNKQPVSNISFKRKLHQLGIPPQEEPSPELAQCAFTPRPGHSHTDKSHPQVGAVGDPSACHFHLAMYPLIFSFVYGL